MEHSHTTRFQVPSLTMIYEGKEEIVYLSRRADSALKLLPELDTATPTTL